MLRFHQVRNLDGYRDVLAEDAEDAGEGIGLVGIRLYRCGFIRFKFQMDTGDVLAEGAKGAKEGIDLFGF
jgi:hypothetical protein